MLTNKVVFMITGKQLQIFGAFAKKPFEEFTLKQIKAESKEKSNNALSIAVKKFRKEGLLHERKLGRSSLFRLNADSDLALSYVQLSGIFRLSRPARQSVRLAEQSIGKHTSFYSIVAFGSCALGEQKKSSDLDVVVFIEKEAMRKKVRKALSSAELKSALKIDGHVITKGEFLKMLKDSEENLGKQIARKHLPICNSRIFYEILKEGMNNGFRF